MKIFCLMFPVCGLILLALISVFGLTVVASALEANSARSAFMRSHSSTGGQKWAKFTSVSLRCTREDGNIYKWCTTVFYGRLPTHCELVRLGCN